MISVHIRSTTGRNQTRKTWLMLIRLIFNNIKTYEIKNFDPCILAQTLGVLFNRKLNLSMNEVLMNQITVTKLTIWENLPSGFRCMWSRHRLFPMKHFDPSSKVVLSDIETASHLRLCESREMLVAGNWVWGTVGASDNSHTRMTSHNFTPFLIDMAGNGIAYHF